MCAASVTSSLAMGLHASLVAPFHDIRSLISTSPEAAEGSYRRSLDGE